MTNLAKYLVPGLMPSLKVNAFYNVLLSVMRVIFPLITAPYVSRVLSPEGVGLFNFSLTYSAYFAMVAALGIPTYGIRAIAACKDDRNSLQTTFSELFSISVFSTLAVSVIYILTLLFVGKLNQDFLIFLLIGFCLYLTPLSIDWYYQGLEDYKYISLRSVFVKFLAVISIFFFVKTRDDLLVYVVINVIANAANNIWNFLKLIASGIRPYLTFKGLSKHMKPVLILFASAVAVSVYTILDTIMLGFMQENSDVAYYSCASNIAKMIVAVISSLASVTMPRIASYAKDGLVGEISALANKSFSAISFLVIPASIGLCCIAPTFAPLFYGDQYYGVILPLQIMSFVILAIGLNNISALQILVSMGKDKEFLRAIIIGASANFCLNLVLIPNYSSAGAAAASVVAETLILVITMIYAKRYTGVCFNRWDDCLKALAASLVFIPLLLLERSVLRGWWLVSVFVLSGFVLYLSLSLLMRNSSVKVYFDAVRNTLKKNKVIS